MGVLKAQGDEGMSAIQFIDESERKYQPMEEIRAQYKGRCVCIVKMNALETGRVFGGEVFAVGDSVPDLIGATREMTEDESFGEIYYPSFKGYGGLSISSVMQVVEHDD
jgi:hypothetical protein